MKILATTTVKKIGAYIKETMKKVCKFKLL